MTGVAWPWRKQSRRVAELHARATETQRRATSAKVEAGGEEASVFALCFAFSTSCSGASAITSPSVSKPARPARPAI